MLHRLEYHPTCFVGWYAYWPSVEEVSQTVALTKEAEVSAFLQFEAGGRRRSGVSATGSHSPTLPAKSAPHHARDAEDLPLLAAKPQWRQIKEMRQGVLAAFVVREPLAYLRDLNI